MAHLFSRRQGDGQVLLVYLVLAGSRVRRVKPGDRDDGAVVVTAVSSASPSPVASPVPSAVPASVAVVVAAVAAVAVVVALAAVARVAGVVAASAVRSTASSVATAVVGPGIVRLGVLRASCC